MLMYLSVSLMSCCWNSPSLHDLWSPPTQLFVTWKLFIYTPPPPPNPPIPLTPTPPPIPGIVWLCEHNTLTKIQRWQQNKCRTIVPKSQTFITDCDPCWCWTAARRGMYLCEIKALMRDGTIQGRGDFPVGQWWWWWSGCWNSHLLTFLTLNTDCQQLGLIPTYKTVIQCWNVTVLKSKFEVQYQSNFLTHLLIQGKEKATGTVFLLHLTISVICYLQLLYIS